VSSRITREAFKKRVAGVLAAWNDWFLFADDYLRGLEATFHRGGLAAGAPSALPAGAYIRPPESFLSLTDWRRPAYPPKVCDVELKKRMIVDSST
jgi:hypothetical protein